MKLLSSDVVELEHEYKHLSEVVKSVKENSEDILDYLNSSEPSSTFFSFFDAESREENNSNFAQLVYWYQKTLRDVVKNLGNDTFTGREKMFNFLEYLRLTCCNENYQINESDFADVSLIPELSYSRMNAALLGKGVCSAQSKFLKDLITYSKALPYGRVTTQTIFVPKGLHDIVVLNSEDENRAITLDPQNYVGSVSSVKRGFDCKKMLLDDSFEGKGFRTTKKDLLKARETVLDYCVRKYGIDKLAHRDFQGASPEEQIEKIERFISSYTTNCKHPLNFDTISVQGHEFEVGKFFEMACHACGIPYELEVPSKEDRAHTVIVLPTINRKINFTQKPKLATSTKENGPIYVKTLVQD